MNSVFEYRNGVLHAEGISFPELGKTYATPLYVYSLTQLNSSISKYLQAFKSHPTLLAYAMKANSNHSILKHIFKRGLGADIVSGGELDRALAAGAKPGKIVYSGVGKTEVELAQALKAGILGFNVESEGELDRISRVAQRLKKRASVLFRINPNIDVKTHPYIATGLFSTKFGVTEEQAVALAGSLSKSWVQCIGLSCHLGSQIDSTGPFKEAAERMASVYEKLREHHPMKYLDLGGGIGIRYEDEQIPAIQQFADAILPEVKRVGAYLILEPGRSIVAQAGGLLCRVLEVKSTPQKTFVIVDGAMTDLIRPALYEAYHEIRSVGEAPAKKAVDVVGPVCETGDFLGLNRKLPELKAGDLIWVENAGAYGSIMSSHYNSRPKTAEVLVEKNRHRLIRKREKVSDLWTAEKGTGSWKSVRA